MIFDKRYKEIMEGFKKPSSDEIVQRIDLQLNQVMKKLLDLSTDVNNHAHSELDYMNGADPTEWAYNLIGDIGYNYDVEIDIDDDGLDIITFAIEIAEDTYAKVEKYIHEMEVDNYDLAILLKKAVKVINRDREEWLRILKLDYNL